MEHDVMSVDLLIDYNMQFDRPLTF